MGKITEELIRKRAEHNECIISTLEEISLHQQDIERIEWIDKWCRDLKILYLQSNLIPKIENVGRLKKLEYLNLTLNNIELIENLEGCESLKKLDLTLNFVGELTSIESLRHLVHLKELYLTGNPCVEYEGYRQYVIATLPQVQSLDGIEIEKSERIKAVQALPEIRGDILAQQEKHRLKRMKEKLVENGKEEVLSKNGTQWYTDINTDRPELSPVITAEEEISEEDKEREFWEEKVPYTPESRLKVHEHMKQQREREEQNSKPGLDPAKRERRLVGEDGRIYNVNEAQVDFELKDDEDNNQLLLDVAIYKHMDTSLCEVDVQPSYVRILIKGKVLQLVLLEEVRPDSSSAKRSQTTGHLLITMPKVKQIIQPMKPKMNKREITSSVKQENHNRTQLLEVDPSVAHCVDLSVVNEEHTKPRLPLLGSNFHVHIPLRANSINFEDDPDVPPLM